MAKKEMVTIFPLILDFSYKSTRRKITTPQGSEGRGFDQL
jgi:hypothetical protein